ncbi:hypothetical protein HED49_21770 [Ochrobactrum daejeonense]|nr:hypothetical protein [Brucella daejeonensis]
MSDETRVPHRGAHSPYGHRLLSADDFCRALNMQASTGLCIKEKAGSTILPRLCNACGFLADPDMLRQGWKRQESADCTDIPLLKLWKFLKFLQSGEKCTAIHGFFLHLSGYPLK